METLFVGCFAFGALFTAISAVLGLAHTSVPGADVGHFGHLGHAPHLPHASHLPHGAPVSHGPHAGHAGARLRLPQVNASSLLAFLTWFGAAGYLGLNTAGWPLPLVLLVATLAGIVGAALIALFMQKVLAGEVVLNQSDFRLEGTLGRISVSIPEGGVGEVLFTKAGRRRGEAARSTSGKAIARDCEVVILGYKRGVAYVQPWEELLRERPPPLATPPSA